MPDSAFAALYRKSLEPGAEPEVLFLRRSNGHWWLPGGKIEPDLTPAETLQQMISQMLTPLNWQPREIGWWRLSPEAGGYAVLLYEGQLLETPKVIPQDPDSGLSEEFIFFSRHRILERLYHQKDMPWGQAKMAIYCIYALHKQGKRADGELLRDDLGELEEIVWNRPG